MKDTRGWQTLQKSHVASLIHPILVHVPQKCATWEALHDMLSKIH